jgi:hypothetical protein
MAVDCVLLGLLGPDDVATSLVTIAGRGQRQRVVQDFQVSLPGSSAISSFGLPQPGSGQLGLLLGLDLRMSIERAANLAVSLDGVVYLDERPAISGPKKVPGFWEPYQQTAQVVVTSTDQRFAVTGHVDALVVFVSQAWFQAVVGQLRATYDQAVSD